MAPQFSIDFWYEFASPYSYLAAMRIEAEAAQHNVLVNWKPFLLGPIFRQLGYQDSPFNAQPIKRDYMWRDMERCCTAQGLAFQRPDPFPGNGIKAARIAMLGADQSWAPHLQRAYTRPTSLKVRTWQVTLFCNPSSKASLRVP